MPGPEGPGRKAGPLTAPSLVIERRPSGALGPRLADDVQRLCEAAYGTATQPYFAFLGPGEHLLGMQGGQLAAHLMWVTRWLQPRGHRPLKTAYVEMVATAPHAQRQGYASALLQHFVPLVGDYDLAALCPATDSLYLRLGWWYWRGPLSARKEDKVVPTPEELVMIMLLPLTPALDVDESLSVEWRSGEVW